MSDKDTEIKNKETVKTVSNTSRSLDLFDVWDEGGDEYEDLDPDISNEFSDFTLKDQKQNTQTSIDDLDAAFDQVISHYEISSSEKKRIEEANLKAENDAKEKAKLDASKAEEMAKREKELQERKKKREKQNKKFAKKNPISQKTPQYKDKYDEFADDYYDY